MSKVNRLASKIINCYEDFGVTLDITEIEDRGDRYIFKIKLSSGTRESHIYKYARDVQLTMRLNLFQVTRKGLVIYIIASIHETVGNELLSILPNPIYLEVIRKMRVPYPIGIDAMGDVVISDLAKFPHLLLGGSTNSGKTIAIKCLITSIVTWRSAKNVNVILIDVGASDLQLFSKIPHLSYPVVEDIDTAFKVLIKLNEEMERRIELEHTSEFSKLPSIVCVIDEFVTLISNMPNTKEPRVLTEILSSLLRRGRHAKIYMVLAAQDPTLKNMKCDIGNITARMAFACAKPTHSVTILGEGGAEKLLGKGDMLFKCREHDGLKHIQGAFISPQDIQKLLNRISFNYDSTNKFVIQQSDLEQLQIEAKDGLSNKLIKNKSENDDVLLAKIIFYALGLNTISGNLIEDIFRLGYKRASAFLNKLHQLNIISDKYAKLPREVIPARFDDLSTELVNFLNTNGYTVEQITKALNTKQ